MKNFILSADAPGNGRKIIVEISDESDVHELLDAFKTLALGLTFLPESWDNAIVEAADIINYHRKDVRQDWRDEVDDIIDTLKQHPDMPHPEDDPDENYDLFMKKFSQKL